MMPDSKDGEQKDQDPQFDIKIEEIDQTEMDSQESISPERKPIDVTITDIELEELKHAAQDYKDKYLRILAESENARKRLIKEKQEMIQYSLQNIICEMLGPIDHMESALKHTENASEGVKQWSIGFQMILAQFKDVLLANNVHSFTSVGKAFDPHLHEAVEMVVTQEHPAGIVVEESVQGYKMGDRVIRPARVKVSKSPSDDNGDDD